MSSTRTGLVVAVAFLASLGSLPVLAALPPYWQRTAELRAIVDSGDVAKALGDNDPIVSITATARDVYEVRNSRCVLEVRIVDIPRAAGEELMPGPREFTVEVGEAKCQ